MSGKDSEPGELSAEIEATIRAACDLLGNLKIEGEKNREKSKSAYGAVLEAHALMTGTLHRAFLRKNGVPGKTTEQVSQRLLLLASFVHGIDLCETSISEGLYIQAAALLKQELETISAIEEVKGGKRKDGKTPNVAYAPWSLGLLYRALNDAAHVGKGDVLQTIIGMTSRGDAHPVSLTPRFIKEIAVRLYGIHTALLTWTCWELDCLFRELYGEGLTDIEKRTLLIALQALQRDGVLGMPGNPTAQQGIQPDDSASGGSTG